MTAAFLNDRTAAAVIGLTHDKVRMLRLRGELAFTSEGRSIQIPRESIEQYIERQRASAEAERRNRMRMSGAPRPDLAPALALIYAPSKQRQRRAAR